MFGRKRDFRIIKRFCSAKNYDLCAEVQIMFSAASNRGCSKPPGLCTRPLVSSCNHRQNLCRGPWTSLHGPFEKQRLIHQISSKLWQTWADGWLLRSPAYLFAWASPWEWIHQTKRKTWTVRWHQMHSLQLQCIPWFGGLWRVTHQVPWQWIRSPCPWTPHRQNPSGARQTCCTGSSPGQGWNFKFQQKIYPVDWAAAVEVLLKLLSSGTIVNVSWKQNHTGPDPCLGNLLPM